MVDVQAPRGGGTGPAPMVIPAVQWYEFALTENLLEEHLAKANPDPSAVQLIVNFMQNADQEALLSLQSARDNAKLDSGDMEETSLDSNCKLQTLRMLTLRVAAFLQWNLTVLEKSIPTPIIQSMLIELLRVAAPDIKDNIHSPDLGETPMSDSALFAVHLFHRWCIRSILRDNFPSRPVKLDFVSQQPGQPDANVRLALASEAIIRKFQEQLPSSISFLEKCCQDQPSVRMPAMPCFLMPDAQSDAVERVDWSKGVTVPPAEVVCQIAYDLGSFYFFEMEYQKAFEKFRACQKILNQLDSPVYCRVCKKQLSGYLASCYGLVGAGNETHEYSLYDRAETARNKGYWGILGVLQEDNLKQELSMEYRTVLQEDLATTEHDQLHLEVSLCNIVRSVAEGQAVVTPVIKALTSAQHATHAFLVHNLICMMKGATHPQRSNLKCFIWYLIELLPADNPFPNLVRESELAMFFEKGEVSDMAVEDLESDLPYLQDLGKDVTLASTASVSTRESSYNVSDVEGQLLSVYDPDVIHDLIVDLYENRSLGTASIIALNERWKVPKEIRQALEFVPEAEYKQAYIFVLIAKARHCMELSLFERARDLLRRADEVVRDLSYVLSKQVRWQALLADLQQFSLSDSDPPSPDLLKMTRTCLTSIRLGQDILPSPEVLEHCTAFLLNVREWDYLSSLENTANGYIEMSRLLASASRLLPFVEDARKKAKDFWQAVVNMYQTNAQHKRSAAGRENVMHRDSQQGVLPRDVFMQFILKIKEPTVLTFLISAFARLHGILKDEVTIDIAAEFTEIWPTAISSVSSTNMNAVEDTLKALMTHVLTVNPSHPSWLRTQADIHFSESQFSTAMKFYLEAGVVCTDFFSMPVPPTVFNDQVYRRMIRCCGNLQCHTQVAVLCQFLERTDYQQAFNALQERTVYDAMDAYYPCIWDVTILEHLVSLHGKRGETDKQACAMRALSQQDVNSHNPDEVKRRAIHVRKTKFLRALAKQYVT